MRQTSNLEQLIANNGGKPSNWRAVAATIVTAFVLVFVLAGVPTAPPPNPITVATLEKPSAAPSARSKTAVTVPAETQALLAAHVVGITDGDTITVISSRQERLTIRLSEIDAPEHGQPGGADARNVLSRLLRGRDVELRVDGKDQYGRTLAHVYRSGADINAEMVRDGHAWAYRDYLTDTSLLSVESEARSAKRGLWALPSRQIEAPWSWRHNETATRDAAPQRVSNPPRSIFTSPASGMHCAGKRYCRQMTSCAEARFYLNVCRVGSLDGDDDGIPCEVICGH